MAKFSTKAASALDKVLRRKSLVDFPGIIRSLEADLRNRQVETANVEKEADRILEVETYLDGSEIPDKGRLFYNLTENLGEDEIPRAIAVAKSVQSLMAATREAWLLKQKAEHEAKGPPTRWDRVWYKHSGPGVNPKQFPI